MSQPSAITAAQRDQFGLIWLTLADGPQYVLSPTDPYGNAPYYRDELARMEQAGEITVTNFVQPEPEPVSPQPAPETTLLYDHENRLRAMEGQPPLSLAEFAAKAKGP